MRKSKPPKRYVLPDPKYKEVLVTKFVNNLMYEGKKSLAYSIFYTALETVEARTKESGLETWRKALNNVMPSVEVKSRRVGGATFQVPTEVRADRKVAVGMKWLIKYARSRGEKNHAGSLSRRDHRGCQRRRCRRQKERRHPPHGRSQQSLLALPLLVIGH